MSEIIKFPGAGNGGNRIEEESFLALDENHLADMLNHLTALAGSSPGSLDRENIELRRKAFEETANNSGLIGQINESGPTDWNAHPAYYHALMAELERRNLIPTRD